MTDEELDALARELPPARREAGRLEGVRTALLAAAADVTPRPAPLLGRRGIAVISGVLAAAAAVAIWVVTDRDASRPARSRATLTPGVDAELAQVGAPPDEIVHLRHGALAVEVAPLGRGERFRLITADAELETRVAHFVVAADHGTVQLVEVVRGELELRLRAGTPTTLRAGERWAAPSPVETTAVPEPPVIVAAVPTAPEPPAHKPTDRPRKANPATSPVPEAPPPPPAAPGEAEFRTGWEALRTGDARRAASAFAASHRAAGRGAVAEDARYWEGVALARAGASRDAMVALRRFLTAHPSSPRAGEASARLGWLLLDAGELAAAERSFAAAAADRVPAVRRSASTGLEKLRALRER
jgi:TolA-binding protein